MGFRESSAEEKRSLIDTTSNPIPSRLESSRASIRLSGALMESFRRLKAHKQHSTLPADAEIAASFEQSLLAMTLPKTPAAQKSKRTEVRAAA